VDTCWRGTVGRKISFGNLLAAIEWVVAYD